MLSSSSLSPNCNSVIAFQSFSYTKSRNYSFFVSCCSTINDSTQTTTTTTTSTTTITTSAANAAPVVKKRRKRYRKLCPGEAKGVVEELRFVAMRLYTDKTSKSNKKVSTKEEEEEEEEEEELEEPVTGGNNVDEGTWTPSMEGFLKYLVDSKLVFGTIERIVDESDHVAYTYFRKTGLERSESLSRDLEWFQRQGVVIPEPSTPGVSYAEYLKELAEQSAPMFLCHFYNIYFAHISGGQVISKQVSEKLLEGQDLEFCRWDGNVQELLKEVREKLNKLGESWSRGDKNKCLREAAKSFRFLGQIVRLIIL